MKWITTLAALAGMVAFLGSSALAVDKPEPKLTCCQQAHADGKECHHKCCLAAHRQGKSCEKCNPHHEDAKLIQKPKKAA